MNYKIEELEHCYSKLSEGRKKLVTPLFLDDETYANQWQAKSYERKKETPDRELLTLKNELVRSKSEVIIANLLRAKKVPYHYEYPFKLRNGVVIYPDFVCLNKRTRQEFYWEHCGKMDDPVYTIRMTQRISEYSRNGVILGKNLIITLETASSPIETKSVERLIDGLLV